MEFIQDKIAEYTAALKEQKTAPNTVAAYERDLYQMAEYFMPDYSGAYRQITQGQLQSYIYQLEADGKRPATIARAVASIKAFFRYLEQSGEIAGSPAQRLKAPRVEKGVPYIMTPQEAVRLLRQPQGDTAKAIRDRAMLELLYATGIRVSELVRLQTDDVNLAMEYLVCSHGARERVIPFGRTAKQSLERYLEKARPELVKDVSCMMLFTNLSGQQMSRQGFWKLLKQYAKAAGIQEEITPHTLRHSFAAHLVNNGADLNAVSRMMGFAGISAAQVYADMHQVSVREAYTKAHPMERDEP
ncbi:MAG: tyrosine recombinase [Acetatifactor sp.]|nr:tyrosine recombinase [Acetatifactor sp.]